MTGFGAVWQGWQVSGIHPKAEGVGGDGLDEKAAPGPAGESAVDPLQTLEGRLAALPY